MSNNDASLVSFEAHGSVTLGTIDNASMLDGLTVNDFGKEVVDHVNAHPASNLLLNFAHVQYLSSAALTELIRINDACVAGKGSLRVCNVSKDIRKVFKITNFDKLFDIHEEELSEAIRRFGRSVDLSREEEEWAKKNKNF
ncbi:MAG: STAS domain-containing protein [Candidatus Hydrogenedentota bacterium]